MKKQKSKLSEHNIRVLLSEKANNGSIMLNSHTEPSLADSQGINQTLKAV